jgi:uncharacterized integral membrane protein
MQFLKTLFWIALTVVLVLFAKANWNAVTLKLWGGLEADVKLPVLVLAAFLLGFLPTFILYRARLWSLKRRLEPPSAMSASPRRRPSRPGDRRQWRGRASRHRQQGLADGMTSPIFVAIDTPDLERAKAIATRVSNHVGGIKLGLEFFCANGRHGVREMAELGLPIFLDLKFHDIPNTVGKAIQALRPLEPAMLTVHAAGGRAMMEDAKAAAPSGTKVVAVTVLTSLDGGDLDSIGLAADPHASGRAADRSGARGRARRGRLLGQRGRGGQEIVAGRLLRRPRRAPGRRPGRRPEKGDDPAEGARRRRLDPGGRPADHPGRGSGLGGEGDRGDALTNVTPAKAGGPVGERHGRN